MSRSSYMFFAQSNYESIRKEAEAAGQKGVKATAVLSGQRWRALSDAERAEWKKKAEEDQAKNPEKYVKRKKEKKEKRAKPYDKKDKKAAPAEASEKKPSKKRAKKGEVAVATA